MRRSTYCHEPFCLKKREIPSVLDGNIWRKERYILAEDLLRDCHETLAIMDDIADALKIVGAKSEENRIVTYLAECLKEQLSDLQDLCGEIEQADSIYTKSEFYP